MMGSIQQRSKSSFELRVSLGFGADGRRKRHIETFRGTKTDAKARLVQLEAEANKGAVASPGRLTVFLWMERWLREFVEDQKREKTTDRYRGVVERHIAPMIGHVRLAKLSPGDVRDMESRLSAAGMKPAGVHVVHNVLSSALKAAMREDLLSRNVASLVTPPKIEESVEEPPTLEEASRMLFLARRANEPHYAAIHLVAFTGMRRGETLGLHWADCDLSNGVIHVEWSLGRSRNGLHFNRPKTKAGRRAIDLDKGTVAVLREHQGTQVLHRSELGEAYQDNDLVFPDEFGRALNPMKLTRAFQHMANRASLITRRLHSLRHFHITDLLQHRENPEVVRERAGHADITTTFRQYGHVMPGWQRDTASAFADRMRLS